MDALKCPITMIPSFSTLFLPQSIPADTFYSSQGSPPVIQVLPLLSTLLQFQPQYEEAVSPSSLPISSPLYSFKTQIKIHLLPKADQD